ncbi:MAG: multidrug effflux MFS transporter [Gemmobacter sp.]
MEPEQPPRPVVRFLDRTTPPHLVTLVLLSGLSALTMNIFLPSLPGMAEWFDAPYRLIQLSVSLYLGISAVMQILIGPLSDRYGRRPVLLWTGAIFILASVGTVLAPTAGIFLFFRMIQAVIAGAMVLSRAIVRDMVPDAQAASMIGYVTMGMALAPMLGPMVGGVLDEAFGWQANFALLVVGGVVVLAITWADLGETTGRRQSSMAEQMRQYPALLRSQRYWGYCLCAAASSGAFFSYLGGAPFVGSEVFGLPPSTLGLYFALTAVSYAVGNFFTGRYSVRVGMIRMILLGSVVLTAGLTLLLLLTLAGFSHPLLFFGLIASVGLGNGMTLPNATAGMMSVRPDLAGSASGLGGAITIGGGAGLSALAGAVLTPGGTEVPLLLLMLFTSVLGLVAIWLVIRRNRKLGL